MTEWCEITEVHGEVLEVLKKNMLPDERFYDMSELFKMFGDFTRMRILFVLSEAEACTCDIAELLNMTASAVSHQLGLLRRAKLVKTRREGKAVFYSLADDHVRTIIKMGMEHIEE